MKRYFDYYNETVFLEIGEIRHLLLSVQNINVLTDMSTDKIIKQAITIDDNRNVYVVSDIHNYADGFKRLLKKIQFNENDLLIIDGDIFDRGDKPVELYFEILKYPNIQVIQGNHDVWVARQIIEQFGHRKIGEYISYNTVAIMEKRLTPVDMLRLAEWIQEKPYYINLTINGRKYQIAHAQTFLTPERMLDKRKIFA